MSSRDFRPPMGAMLISQRYRLQHQLDEPTLSSSTLKKADDLLESLDDHYPYENVFGSVEQLYIAGGGGAGRSLPGAFVEAEKFGLDFKNVNVVCGTSVGSISALGIALGIKTQDMTSVLDDIPAERFQDWSFWSSISNFFTRWGWCEGKEFSAYFREYIFERTKQDLGEDKALWDPTFLELYNAGYTKELRVITSNLDKLEPSVFSYKLTPHKKVADIVGLSCSVPIMFPPQQITSPEGVREWHTDGGVLLNYPFAAGNTEAVEFDKMLGFLFVNGTTAEKIRPKYGPGINSFIQFCITLVSAILFQQPLSLSQQVKDRTVAIRINHNPAKFTATPEEQRVLDKGGKDAVRALAEDIKLKRQKAYNLALTQQTIKTYRRMSLSSIDLQASDPLKPKSKKQVRFA